VKTGVNMKCMEEALHGNDELVRVGFLIEVRPTIKGFPKSFSRRELKEELKTGVGKIQQHFIKKVQANLYIAYKLIHRRKEWEKIVGEALQPSFYDKLLTLAYIPTLTSMTRFSNLACTPRLSQGDDKWHKERASPYPNLDSLIMPNIIYGPQGPTLTLHGPKIQDPNYSKQFIQFRGLFLDALFSPKLFL